ncbi:preprotein translocase subunit SecE [Candidatus Dojkabacteria bacterium]|uniref:Preprotein translocase subunit SecE n=1 Tax=Candidatus Dojkabacteria bacterium TaxID=2099670 RepID=A0A955L7J3_9BACT|nr:preprotein translocase subunit SecE [Candidatus Dojkabacteria bacterium]
MALQPIRFVKSIVAEMKRVEWLAFPELMKYSGLVIAFVVISTIVIAYTDILLIGTRGIVANCFDEDNFTQCAREELGWATPEEEVSIEPEVSTPEESVENTEEITDETNTDENTN